MKKLAKNILYCMDSQNVDSDLLNKIFFFNSIFILYLVVAIPFIIIHIINKNFFLLFILSSGLIFLSIMKFLICNTKKYKFIFSATALMMVTIFLSNFITGGTDNNGPLWYYSFPMMALILLGLKQGSLFSISLLIISFLLLVNPFNRIMMTAYNPTFLIRFFISYTLVFILAFIYEFQKQKTRKELKELKGFLPICSHCKKIRDDKGYWNQVEKYIQNHSDAKFSHGICPECSDELYGKEDWYIEMKNEEKQKNERMAMCVDKTS